jgi:hypothetical protein
MHGAKAGGAALGRAPTGGEEGRVAGSPRGGGVGVSSDGRAGVDVDDGDEVRRRRGASRSSAPAPIRSRTAFSAARSAPAPGSSAPARRRGGEARDGSPSPSLLLPLLLLTSRSRHKAAKGEKIPNWRRDLLGLGCWVFGCAWVKGARGQRGARLFPLPFLGGEGAARGPACVLKLPGAKE